MWLCGTVFVNRKSGPGAIELLKKTAEDIKRKRVFKYYYVFISFVQFWPISIKQILQFKLDYHTAVSLQSNKFTFGRFLNYS